MASSNKSMLPVSTLLLLLLLSLSSSSAFLTPTAVRLGSSSTSLRRASCPVRMMAGGVAAADLEADKKIVKRVAMEKEGELQEVLAAVKRLETAGRQMKDEAENLKMLEKLTGKWRLICTTGDKSGSKITGGKLSYFPIKAVQEFDTTSSPMFIQNGVYLGPLSFEFRGEMELFPKMRRLEFFFNKVALGPLAFDIEVGKDAKVKPSFAWIDVNDDYALARGAGGGFGLWKRVTE